MQWGSKTLVLMITPLFKSFFKSPNLSKKFFTSSASTSASTLTNSRPFTSRLTAHLLYNPNGYGKRLVGYWLAGCSAAVFGIIVFGGLTRLTESGLSMVDWKLVHFKAPQTAAEWETYFALYQQYPEYQLLNKEMTLDQFKRIYYMEHYHRVYGRFLGLGIILPSIAFSLMPGFVSPRTKKFLMASSSLVVFQGLLGWYMVKSGLDAKKVEEAGGVPRVSAYRLAAHLGSAFALYGLLLNTSINVLKRAPTIPSQISLPKALASRAHGVAGLVFLTALSGAFVAGLDAGLIYNEFPLMGGRLIPSDLYNPRLGLKNPFENPACAQFCHRALAIGSVSAVSALWYKYRHVSAVKRPLAVLLMVAWGQGSLGVLTLLSGVEIELASAHQAGSVTVLSVALYLVNRLKSLMK